jgi:hypothetical protein
MAIMGLFSERKQPVGDVDAVLEFFADTASRFEALYPTILDQTFYPAVPRTLEANPEFFQQTWVRRVIQLSVVGLELHALNNVSSPEMAERLYTVARAALLVSGNMDKSPFLVLDRIKETMQRVKALETHPVQGLGKTLYEMLDLKETMTMDGELYMSPLALSGLGAGLYELCGGWWKNALQRYEIS